MEWFKGLDAAVQVALIPAAFAFLGIFAKGFIDILGDVLNRIKLKEKSEVKRLKPKKPSYNSRLGDVYYEHENFKKALECYEKATKDYVFDSINYAVTLEYMGNCNVELLYHEPALECFFEARAIYYKRKKAQHVDLLLNSISIAIVYTAQSEFAEALVMYLKIYSSSRRKLGGKRRIARLALAGLRFVYKEAGYKETFVDWLAKQIHLTHRELKRLRVPSL